MSEEYFVQIRDTDEVRRKLLGSSKQIIGVLQRYEMLKQTRVIKLEKMSQLRRTNKEINLLIAKLKKEMPKAEMRISTTRKAKVDGTEIAELEAELKRIEDKIGMLG